MVIKISIFQADGIDGILDLEEKMNSFFVQEGITRKNLIDSDYQPVRKTNGEILHLYSVIYEGD